MPALVLYCNDVFDMVVKVLAKRCKLLVGCSPEYASTANTNSTSLRGGTVCAFHLHLLIQVEIV